VLCDARGELSRNGLEQQQGGTSTVMFPVTDLDTFDTSNFAIDDVAGIAPALNGSTSYTVSPFPGSSRSTIGQT